MYTHLQADGFARARQSLHLLAIIRHLERCSRSRLAPNCDRVLGLHFGCFSDLWPAAGSFFHFRCGGVHLSCGCAASQLCGHLPLRGRLLWWDFLFYRLLWSVVSGYSPDPRSTECCASGLHPDRIVVPTNPSRLLPSGFVPHPYVRRLDKLVVTSLRNVRFAHSFVARPSISSLALTGR